MKIKLAKDVKINYNKKVKIGGAVPFCAPIKGLCLNSKGSGVNPFTVNPSGQALRTSLFRMNP